MVTNSEELRAELTDLCHHKRRPITVPTYARRSKRELTQCGYPNHIVVATKDRRVAIINRQSLYYSTAKKKKIALQGQVFDTYEDAIMAIKETKPYQDPRGQWRQSQQSAGDLAD